jgi:hypothetical protein
MPTTTGDISPEKVKTKPSKNHKVDIKIGDAVEESPKLKLTKESKGTISAILKDTDATVYSEDKDVHTWTGTKQTINLYEHTTGSPQEPEEGGYEYEVILNSKPASNVLSFDIDLTGLESYYQAPMNEVHPEDSNATETTSGSAYRPVNVVGSYAFYYIAGGKAFHLYRPLITDHIGNTVWGVLNISGPTMTITIDQSFLDNATYPVTVDPTWGYTSVGASSDYWPNVGYAYRFTAPMDIGTLNTINCYSKVASGTQNLKGAIWDTSTDYNIIANSVTANWSASSDYAWGSGAFSTQPTISGGTDYFIGVVQDSGSFYYKFDAGTAGYFIRGYNVYAAPQAFSSPTAGSDKFGIYIDYTASGGGGTNYAIETTDAAAAGTSLKLNYDAGLAERPAATAGTAIVLVKDTGIWTTVTAAAGTTLNGVKDNGLGITVNGVSGTTFDLVVTAAGVVYLTATINGVSNTIFGLSADRAMGETVNAVSNSVIYLNEDYSLSFKADGLGGTTITLSSTGSTPVVVTVRKKYWYEWGEGAVPSWTHGKGKHANRHEDGRP